MILATRRFEAAPGGARPGADCVERPNQLADATRPKVGNAFCSRFGKGCHLLVTCNAKKMLSTKKVVHPLKTLTQQR